MKQSSIHQPEEPVSIRLVDVFQSGENSTMIQWMDKQQRIENRMGNKMGSVIGGKLGGWWLVLSVLCLLFVCGCGKDTLNDGTQGQGDPVLAEDMITFTDDLGTVWKMQRPKRVVAMIGSFADIWYLAGGQETLVATAHDAWTSFELELGNQVKDIGAVKEPNLETILAAEPDLILASSQTAANLALQETFQLAKIPAAYFEVSGFEDYLRMLEVCSRLTGSADSYKQNGTEIQQQVNAAIDRQTGEAPKVVYIRATGSSCKVKGSSGSVLGEMLSCLGCVNIADSQRTLLENLSLEKIIEEDPDHIFVVLQGADPADAQKTMENTLLSNPAWNQLRAVKEGRFHVLEHRLYNLKPNARWGYAYEKLADILYPVGH